jgi:hypothetical protein
MQDCSSIRSKGAIMAAVPTSYDDEAADEESASARVESFLECVETKRRRTVRIRLVAAAVGGVVATVAFLTSLGVVTPDAGRFVASAGALVAGLLVSEP